MIPDSMIHDMKTIFSRIALSFSSWIAIYLKHSLAAIVSDCDQVLSKIKRK